MKKVFGQLFGFRRAAKVNAGYLLSLAISILLALLVGAGIMALSGHDPIGGYGALITGALSSKRAIGDTLAKTATLCLLGLSVAIAAQAGIFNCGGEGQLYFGAMASALVGGEIKRCTRGDRRSAVPDRRDAGGRILGVHSGMVQGEAEGQ